MRLALMGPKLHSVLWDLLEVRLRGYLKYGHTFKTADEAIEAIADAVREDLPGDFWDIE